MNLGLYLWKEWRDQRAGLARLAAVLVLLAACALFLPKPIANDPLFLAGFVGAALAAFALSVGPDLLAAELTRDRVRLLERMPAGLSVAFLAKLLVYAGAFLATAVLGLALALAVSLARAGELPPWPTGLGRIDVLLAVAALPGWTFALSTWVPRSALALPVSAVVVALLAWPLWLVVGPSDWYLPARGELELCVALCLVAAAVSAWASFVLGFRRGGGPGRAFALGLGAACLTLLPAWSWTAANALAQRRIDPGEPGFRIRAAILGAGGRMLFAQCEIERPERQVRGHAIHAPTSVIVVDLADGTWRSIAGAYFGTYRTFGAAAIRLCEGDEEVWLDGRSGERLLEPPVEPPATFLPAPEELGLPADLEATSRQGLGYRVRGAYYDPFRRRTFSFEEVEALGISFLKIRRGDWIAREKETPRRWCLVDPVTGERARVAGLREGEHVSGLVFDGRALVTGDGEAVLLDPETGVRTSLGFEDGFDEPVRVVLPLERQSRALDLVYVAAESWRGLARLHPRSGLLQRAAGASGQVDYLGGPDEHTAYVLEDYQRVVRLRFGTEERAVLFPPTEDGR